MDADEREDEMAVRSWRYEQARRLGLKGDDAGRFADSDGDIEQLRQLITKKGCDPETAVRIVA